MKKQGNKPAPLMAAMDEQLSDSQFDNLMLALSSRLKLICESIDEVEIRLKHGHVDDDALFEYRGLVLNREDTEAIFEKLGLDPG